MHVIAILALDGVVPFDLAAPLEVFGQTRLLDGTSAYAPQVCGVQPHVDAGAFKVEIPGTLDDLVGADTVVVPGLADPLAPVPERALDALRAAADAGSRIASVCSGAFILAATGLLDGRRATTHWSWSADLARLYPAVDVDPGVLFVDEGAVLTSAGAAAAFDLCLHMIRGDYGAAVAADAGRRSVMPLERPGGQSQFIVHQSAPEDGASLSPVLRYLEDNLDRSITLEHIAERAMMSPRSLNRRFREQTGTTPLRWLHLRRVRRAQILLETTDASIERIALDVGYASPTTFRARFRDAVGTSPQAYRRAFAGPAPQR